MKSLDEEKNIVYIDHPNEAVSIIFHSKKTVFTGIALHLEPLKVKKFDILKTFEKEDFHFFFENEEPQLFMYAVPFLLILGYDSCGGYFATADCNYSFEENFPMYYISCDFSVYKIDADSTLLVTGKSDWKAHLIQTDEVKIYPSRQMAEKDYCIHNVQEFINETFE